jgi:hypothetical protein
MKLSGFRGSRIHAKLFPIHVSILRLLNDDAAISSLKSVFMEQIPGQAASRIFRAGARSRNSLHFPAVVFMLENSVS